MGWRSPSEVQQNVTTFNNKIRSCTWAKRIYIWQLLSSCRAPLTRRSDAAELTRRKVTVELLVDIPGSPELPGVICFCVREDTTVTPPRVMGCVSAGSFVYFRHSGRRASAFTRRRRNAPCPATSRRHKSTFITLYFGLTWTEPSNPLLFTGTTAGVRAPLLGGLGTRLVPWQVGGGSDAAWARLLSVSIYMYIYVNK